MPPNVFECKCMDYEGILKLVSIYFKTKIKILSEKPDESTSYILKRKKGMHIRLLIIKLTDFNKDCFKKVKASANRKINKVNNVKHFIPLSDAGKAVRVNFIIIDNKNEYAENLMLQNADILFSRVEGILNIVLCISEGRLYIPAHFGISAFTKYHKIYKIMLACIGLKD